MSSGHPWISTPSIAWITFAPFKSSMQISTLEQKVARMLLSELTKIVPTNPEQEINEYCPYPSTAISSSTLESMFFPKENACMVGLRPSYFWKYYLMKLPCPDGGKMFGSPSVRSIMDWCRPMSVNSIRIISSASFSPPQIFVWPSASNRSNESIAFYFSESVILVSLKSTRPTLLKLTNPNLSFSFNF